MNGFNKGHRVGVHEHGVDLVEPDWRVKISERKGVTLKAPIK
jgi:hypothetical protein